ncbi:MAG: MFS transporter [Planctomycetaceae bacterium]|nr:MFS transporter [Planctomycetales bacterium]MCB9875575.1 MFS transporter [Planctomycetaceae bacterium]
MTEGNAKARELQTRSSLNMMSRLSFMMFLQYFVQGAYQPVVTVYVLKTLHFTESQAGAFSAMLSVGPLIAPFFVGQMVDRYFATERVLAVFHLLGGVLMLALYTQTAFWPVIILGTLYSVLYVPTMMLTNALAFRHLRNRELEFPWVRLFGTIGFMVPAYLVEFWWLWGLEGETLNRARGIVFAFSGIVGVVMAVYCMTLPKTPPEPNETRKYAPGAAVQQLLTKHFLALVVISFFIAIAHKFFWFWNSPFLRAILDSGGIEGAYEQSLSSIGQFCEIFVMAGLGFAIRRFGFKWTMVAGTIAYAVRCLMFAAVFSLDPAFSGKLAIAIIGQALHGFCFGCFLAAGYMYVDKAAPSDLRGSMQTLYGTFVVAVGLFVGGFVSGEVGRLFSTGTGDSLTRDWTSIWLSCAAFSSVCVVLFALFFPGRTPTEESVVA